MNIVCMYMRNLILFFLVLGLSSCVHLGPVHKGNGEIVTKTYHLDSFDKVRLEGNFKVSFEKTESESLFIEIDENLLEHVEVDVKGNTLVVESHETLLSKDGIKLVIGYRDIEEIEISGACAISAQESITSNFLKMNLAGAGAVDLDLDVKELEISISGAGAINLSGNVRDLDIEMSGAGGLSAFNLVSKTCKVEISGIGSADVFVEEELNASISGMGGINYKGDPVVVRSDVSGLGNVERIN